ncbi:MAG: CPBP family intramembrane glutamic endopeptidase [Candidatus Thorarchaeota archaeon]
MNITDNKRNLKDYPLLSGIIITVIFSVILSINEIFEVFTYFRDGGISQEVSYLIDFSVRFFSGVVVVIIIIPAILYLSIRHVHLREYFHDMNFTRGFSLNPSFLAGIISASCYFLICIVIASALGTLWIDFSIIVDLETGIGWIVFLYALVPAIWEELTFRGAILNTVRAKYSDSIAILISSVFFGLFHIIAFALVGDYAMAVFGFIMSTLFGLTWGYTNIKCDSLLPGIVAHYVIDAFGYAFIYHSLNAEPSLVGLFFISTTILYPLITIVLAKVFLKQKKGHLN